MLMKLEGPSLAPASGGKPRQLVILLHGLGADGNDLIGLADYWRRLLPEAAFVAPNAPFPCDMGPYGYQWFSLQDRTPAMIQAGVRAAAPILDNFIDETLAALGLEERNLALVGFSQGTMMSLFVALRRAQPVAGVLGFSGALVAPETLPEEIRSRPRVLLLHGDADEVVSFEAMGAVEAALRQNDVTVETIRRPGLGHAIDQTGLMRGGAFLEEVFR
jgi:phospholipase/carboxylesterase